ncbi:MAG: type II toxin-antitoxin system RelE/ParE family toxin [Deinococcota bacterium]|nr:type II toxin-antitoxin system RelE/ParE family toxin [Deinococcota bacterium]
MYSVRILDAASQELAKLDKSVARRIIKRVNWLAGHVEDIKPEVLTGGLAHLFKLRVGDYRVLYQILEDEQRIVIHKVGHRRNVYRMR